MPWCLALSLLVVAGCTRWRVEHVSPVALMSSEPPARIRVTRIDTSRIELHQPRIVGDTIVDGRTTSVKVPLSDVAQVAVRKWDLFGSAGVVVGSMALGAVIAIGFMWDARAD